MGYGDELMATGMARGLAAQGKLAAFGDGRRIVFSRQSHDIFWGNPNICPPGLERRARNLVWFHHYRGCRLYAFSAGGRWHWNPNFRAIPGEVYLTPHEIMRAEEHGRDFVLIEPNVKATAPNKQWPLDRYLAVARKLQETHRVVQFQGPNQLDGVEVVRTRDFREAMAILKNAALFVGPEGGLHHAAAALGVRAVVIFGGFIHPQTTGYDFHVNLFMGRDACGTIGRKCQHCYMAMRAITVTKVFREARRELDEKRKGILPAGQRGAPGLVPGEWAGVRWGSDLPVAQAPPVSSVRPKFQARR